MNKNRNIIITSITVAILIVGVLGASYAYFQAYIGTASTTTMNVQTSTVDSCSGSNGTALNIYATQANFGQGAGNQVDSTSNSIVTMVANNANAAKCCYTAKVNISSNDFIYTVNSSTPELVLTLTKNGTAVVTNQDITTATGYVYNTMQSLSASAGQTVSDNWSATVTFKNLGSVQNANANKHMAATLVLTPTSTTTGSC